MSDCGFFQLYAIGLTAVYIGTYLVTIRLHRKHIAASNDLIAVQRKLLNNMTEELQQKNNILALYKMVVHGGLQ